VLGAPSAVELSTNADEGPPADVDDEPSTDVEEGPLTDVDDGTSTKLDVVLSTDSEREPSTAVVGAVVSCIGAVDMQLVRAQIVDRNESEILRDIRRPPCKA
jgi:hypothetical protein